MKQLPDIRFAKRSDLPQLVAIYNKAIQSRSATGHMKEFTVEERIVWLNQHDTDHYPIYVAHLQDRVVGFGTLSPYRAGRQAMDRIAEVSFFVDYEYHKKGIGSVLLKHMIQDCPRLKLLHIVAILLDCNPGSIKLLEKFGFECWGRLPGVIHFEDKTCDHLYYGKNVT